MKEQTEVGKLKEGRYVIVDDEPCRIVSIAISKPGKHGAAKSGSRMSVSLTISSAQSSAGIGKYTFQSWNGRLLNHIDRRHKRQFMDVKDEMFELNLTGESAIERQGSP